MNKELESRAKELWDRSERNNKFNSQFKFYPPQEGGRLVDDFQRLSEEIQSLTPTTTEEVQNNELKRRLSGEALLLDHTLKGHSYTFEDVVSLYGIDPEDIKGLKSWLMNNKDETLATIDKVYRKTEVNGYKLGIPKDIPLLNRQAEEFTTTHIGNYHKILSRQFEKLTSVGNFLKDIISLPTTDDRSYFNSLTKTLALSIPQICYLTEDKSLHIDERELLHLFGHEGMGHALNQIVTERSELPFFLKKESETTRASSESVAQYYEAIIFKDLASSQETQNDLGIKDKFADIYQNHIDIQLINLYYQKLYYYAITVLADKNLGDMSSPESKKEAISKRISLISEVTFNQGYAVNIVEKHQNDFDSQGNLSFKLAYELVYSAQPVQKVIDKMQQKGVLYDENGREKIDILLLTGFWTPIGLVENASTTVV